MRNLLAIVVLALTSGMGFAGTATAQVPAEDSVTGAGATPFGFFVEIDAHSGPSGENANGTLAITEPFSQPSEFGVVCLRVTGNTAVFGANSQGPEARSGLFRVVDGSPDTLEADHLDVPAGPDDCAKPFEADEGPTVPSSGDFVVTDAQPSRRMVGKGSVSADGLKAAYAYILPCDATQDTDAHFEARTGANSLRLTSVESVVCRDDPAVSTPVAGFDTQRGTGTATLNGRPGYELKWKLVDGGLGGTNDFVRARVTGPGGAVVFRGSAAPPGKFPGSDQPTGNNTAQLLR